MGRKFYIAAQPWAATQEQNRLSAEVDEVERISPARQPTLESDVLVPMAWSLITGALSFLAVAVVAVSSGKPLWLAFALGFFTTALAWMWKSSMIHGLLQTVETITNRDIDGDGQIGNQEPAAPRVLEVHLRKGNHLQIITSSQLGIDDEKLEAVADYIVNGGSIAEAVIGNRKDMFSSINEYKLFRSRAEAAGLVVNPGGGYKLTDDGAAYFQRIADGD